MSERGGKRSFAAAEVVEAVLFLIAAAISPVKCNVKQGANHANTESEQGLSAFGCSGDHTIDDEEPSRVDAKCGDQLEPNGQVPPPASVAFKMIHSAAYAPGSECLQLGVNGLSAIGKAEGASGAPERVESRHLSARMLGKAPMFTARYSATISDNRISLTNTLTGETIARAASEPFSSEEDLIADQKSAASLAGDLIRQIEGRGRWLRIFPTICVTIAREPRSPKDFDDVHRLFHEQGFVRVRVK